MCGILGYSGPEPYDQSKINILMYINSIERGQDATGMYSPINGLKKSLEAGWKFATNGDNDFKPDTLFIGHVRAATVGPKTKVDNAHPFERGNCILAHNGTLTNYYAILKSRDLDYMKYDVDSDVVCGAINKDDNFDVLKQLEGAAAMLITDKRSPDTLYVFRKGASTDKDRRPLWKGYVGENLYISSVPESLLLIGCTSIKEFKENYLYTIKAGKIIGSARKIKNDPIQLKDVKTTPITRSNSSTLPVAINHNVPTLDMAGMSAKLQHMKQVINCWLRAKHTLSITLPGGTLKLKINKGSYYRITDIVHDKVYKVFNEEDKQSYMVSAQVFEEMDIIRSGSIVVALKDIFNLADPDRITPVIRKGEEIKVDDSFADGDVGFEFLLDTSNTFYCKKYLFRKLTLMEYDAWFEKQEVLAANRRDALKVVKDMQDATTDSKEIPWRLDSAEPEDKGWQYPATDIFCVEDELGDPVIIDHIPLMKYAEINRVLPVHFEEMDLELEGLKMLCKSSYVADDILDQVEEVVIKNWKMYKEMYRDADDK